MTRPNPQYHRESCYFCDESDKHILEQHHIVPQRYGGADRSENLVRVCPTCHEKLERLYDQRFYDELGVRSVEIETVDVDEVDTATGSQRKDITKIRETLTDLQQYYYPVSERRLRQVLVAVHDMEDSTISERLDSLKQRGEVFEPKTRCLAHI